MPTPNEFPDVLTDLRRGVEQKMADASEALDAPRKAIKDALDKGMQKLSTSLGELRASISGSEDTTLVAKQAKVAPSVVNKDLGIAKK